jgi:hypothetical protein
MTVVLEQHRRSCFTQHVSEMCPALFSWPLMPSFNSIHRIEEDTANDVMGM